MLRTLSRNPSLRAQRLAMRDESYSDQLEQEIATNRDLWGRLRKAQRRSRRNELQQKKLEESVKGYENELQKPWAESHKLRNELKNLQEIKDNTVKAQQRLETQLSNAQATNNELTIKKEALIERLAESIHLEKNLTAENAKLKKSLEKSRRETETANKSSKRWVNRRVCRICTYAEANRLTECGHLFCKKCLDNWEKRWYQETDRGGNMQGRLKGILTCPKCRQWVVMSRVKTMFID